LVYNKDPKNPQHTDKVKIHLSYLQKLCLMQHITILLMS